VGTNGFCAKYGPGFRSPALVAGGPYDALNVPIAVETAEVELGLSFSAEGQIFIAKSKAEGTLKIKVVFKTMPPAVGRTQDAAKTTKS
jgi:hypothetical protein